MRMTDTCRRQPLVTMTAALSLLGLAPAQAENSATPSNWEFGAAVYLWAPKIEAQTPRGANISLPFDDILDNLEFTFMGMFEGRKDKWSFMTDLIYMDLSHGKTFRGPDLRPDLDPDLTVNARGTLTAWIITPTAGYNVIADARNTLDVIGGLRYVDIDAKLRLSGDLGPYDGARSAKDSFDNFDGIVGIRGSTWISDRWTLNYYLDGGTGQSDYTWQIAGSVGYHYDRFEIRGGYRYLDWDFGEDNNNLMKDLDIKGPFLGAGYKF